MFIILVYSSVLVRGCSDEVQSVEALQVASFFISIGNLLNYELIVGDLCVTIIG